MADLSYREHPPGPELRPYVQSLWELRGACTEAAPHLIIPDGCISLVLNFGGPAEQVVEGSPAIAQPRTLVIGEVRRPIALQSVGEVELLGVRFWPGAIRAFLTGPVAPLVDALTDDASLGAILARSVTRTIHGAEPADRRRFLHQALIEQLRLSRKRPTLIRTAVRALVQHEGRVTIDDLAGMLEVSRRALEREFAEEVGIPPKSLARVLRFRSVLRAIDGGASSWAAISADCGYYDQSHLIRDFKLFTGSTPRAFLGEGHPLSRSRNAIGGADGR